MKKIAVVGSRKYSKLEKVREFVRSLPPDTVIVSGGAEGVDREAQYSAEEVGMKTLIFLPMWSIYGKSAGYLRNIQIVEAADEIVAFWDGESKGTKHSIDLAAKIGKKVTIIGLQD